MENFEIQHTPAHYVFWGHSHEAPLTFHLSPIYSAFCADKIIGQTNSFIAEQVEDENVNFDDVGVNEYFLMKSPENLATQDYLAFLHQQTFGQIRSVAVNDFIGMVRNNVSDDDWDNFWRNKCHEIENCINKQFPNSPDNLVVVANFSALTENGARARAMDLYVQHAAVIVNGLAEIAMTQTNKGIDDWDFDDLIDVFTGHLLKMETVALDWVQNHFQTIANDVQIPESGLISHNQVMLPPDFTFAPNVENGSKLDMSNYFTSPISAQYDALLSALFSCNAADLMELITGNGVSELVSMIEQCEAARAAHNAQSANKQAVVADVFSHLSNLYTQFTQDDTAKQILNFVFDAAPVREKGFLDLFVNQNHVLAMYPKLKEAVLLQIQKTLNDNTSLNDETKETIFHDYCAILNIATLTPKAAA